MASTNEPMGRLERVDLNEAWETEDGDFTPWLAEEENIALLGDAIGIDLEVEAQEMRVGLFRADIVCLDTASLDNHRVLVENQLYRTDHTHLGQLMTYAAGLDAVTIVWIARQFTDEHRASLDWLNEITEEEIRFFGIEVELWRIGDSPPAPKFNIVSKPNDWTAASNRVRQQLRTELTPYKQMQVDFWGALKELMQQRQGNVRPRTGGPQYWLGFSIGRSGFQLIANIRINQNSMIVGLGLDGNDSKKHLALLLEDKDEIERELGETLQWSAEPGQRSCSIGTGGRDDCDLMNRDNWPAYLDWMYEQLETFHRVFAPRIKNLDASDIPNDLDPDSISVSKQNDWTEFASIERDKLTPTQLMQLEYWEALHELMKERKGNVPLTRPYPHYRMNPSFGISEITNKEFMLSANFRVRENSVSAGVNIEGDNAEAHFYLLRKQRKELDQALDEILEWDPRPNAQFCFVRIWHSVSDLKDRSIWPDLLEWHYTKLEDLHRVFAPRIIALDASDYIPGETDLDDTEDNLA